MKKLIVLAMALAMIGGMFGTATAADYVVNLANYEQFYASPVAANGTTVFVLSGANPMNDVPTGTGATLWQINPATGVSAAFQNTLTTSTGGTTAFSTPVLWQASGDSGVTLVMNVFKTNYLPSATNTLNGTSLFAVYFSGTGTGTTNWVRSLDYRFGSDLSADPSLPSVAGGVTAWATHLLVETDSTTGGTSVYGTTGMRAPTGASIWAISLGQQTGSVAQTNNQWSTSGGSSGVSSIWAAPAISGNSLFVIGSVETYSPSGVSLLMFDKRKLNAGPNRGITILGSNSTAMTTPFATPAIAGNSLFVVDARGGLTAYSISSANLLPAARTTGDFIQLGNTETTAVTASPVTDGAWLVVTANNTANFTAGVTVFKINTNRLSGSSAVSWWYTYTAGTTISATPAISGGYVYVIANHSGAGAEISRFALSRSATGPIASAEQTITIDKNGAALGFAEASSPIIVDNRMIYVSNSAKRLYSFDSLVGVGGNAAWTQFKADAARTGTNTRALAAVVPDDGDSGCFISIIK
jgi:hypothetical protein